MGFASFTSHLKVCKMEFCQQSVDEITGVVVNVVLYKLFIFFVSEQDDHDAHDCIVLPETYLFSLFRFYFKSN